MSLHPRDGLALGLVLICLLTTALVVLLDLSVAEAVALYCLFAGAWVLRWTLTRRD